MSLPEAPEYIAHRTMKCHLAAAFCFRLFGVLAGVMLVGWILWVSLQKEAAVEAFQSIRPYLILWRMLLLITFIGFWRHWVKRFSDWAALSPEDQDYLLRFRWRCFGLLILFDVLVIQNGLGWLINLGWQS